jgi:hypothetical protein
MVQSLGHAGGGPLIPAAAQRGRRAGVVGETAVAAAKLPTPLSRPPSAGTPLPSVLGPPLGACPYGSTVTDVGAAVVDVAIAVVVVGAAVVDGTVVCGTVVAVPEGSVVVGEPGHVGTVTGDP